MKSFPKIFALGTKYVSGIFDDEVEITEKIDGSQFVFGKIDGEIVMKSKKAVIQPEVAPDLFKPAVEYVMSIADKIPDNTIFYSETLSKEKHNVLKYDRIPKNHIILFGVCDKEENFDPDIQKYAELLDVEAVPVIYKGAIDNVEKVFEMIDQDSALGGVKMEGVVVKNYNKPFLFGDIPFPLMSAKYVSEGFKEVHDRNWKKDFNSKTKTQVFFDSFRTEARWDKAVQHLNEQGELEGSPKDIGKLMKEVNQDINEEEKENIKEWLWNEYKGQLSKTATRGLPEWYKKKIAVEGTDNK